MLNSIDGALPKRRERFDKTFEFRRKRVSHDRKRRTRAEASVTGASLSIYLRIVSATWKQRRRRPVQPSAKHLNLPALMPTVYTRQRSAANHRFIEATINPSATESPYLADIRTHVYTRAGVRDLGLVPPVSIPRNSEPRPRKVYGDV